MRFTNGIGILLVFFLGACDKNELPEDLIGTPSFFAEGTVDGEPLFFSAGPENVIIESGFEIAENDLPVFSAAFSNADCQVCSQSLFLEIIGTTEFQEDLGILDYVPEGSYSISNYQSGQGESLFHFEFDNVNVVGLILENDDGLILFSDTEIPDMELQDGAYSLSTIYEDESMSCFGTQNLLFYIENGALCGSIPTIEITEDGILTISTNPDSEILFLVVLNDIPFPDVTPGMQIDLDEVLGEDVMLESINLIDFSGSPCPTNAMWTFDGLDDNYCSISTSITQIEALEHEPMTAIVKYTDEDFNTYISSTSNTDQMDILNMEPIMDESLQSETYRCDFILNTYLINTADPKDSIHFVVSSASIPLGME